MRNHHQVAEDVEGFIAWLLREPREISRLLRRHRPERGMCFTCSQRGAPWPCVMASIASQAARRIPIVTVSADRRAS